MPLIVVSPYAKSANISYTVYVFGSILKFIEKTLAQASGSLLGMEQKET
jgi:hypothetical protein